MKSKLSRRLRIAGQTRGSSVSAFAAAAPKVEDFEALAASDLLGHDPPLATRDEAVFLLHTAAEVEHALMVQYLYAAYSLGGPQVPPDKQQLVGNWRRSIIRIAREEMAHLASVQNLLRFIGGPLNLEREDFPFRTGLYPFRFKLERLTKDSLAKYVYAEMPEGLAGDDIEEIRRRAIGANADAVNHVGRLYQSIARLFARREADGTFSLREEDLQPESVSFQADTEWTQNRPSLIIRQVKTREGATDGAIPLIQAIAVQGEGMPATGNFQDSHYQLFRDIYDVFPEPTADWQPSRSVPEDPNTSEPDPDPEPGPDTEAEEQASRGRITHPLSRLWAQLLNLRYRMLLTNIFHRLHLDGPSDEEPKSRILEWYFTEMADNVRSISSFLIEMPQRREDTAGPPFAASTFELPYSLSFPDSPANRWRLHRDLFRASRDLIGRIQQVETDDARRDFLRNLGEHDDLDLRFAEAHITLSPQPPVITPPPDVEPPPAVGRFTEVKNILEESVSGTDIDAHGNFWRDETRDRFVALSVFGRPLFSRRADGSFDENESNLVKALEGRSPFGRDSGTPGATIRRMPAGLAPVSPEQIEVVRRWIRDGCPDDAP